MTLIDFDRYFQLYTKEWLEANKARFQTVEQMEEHIQEIYLRWLNTPAEWLDDDTPAEFFQRFDDVRPLVAWLREYLYADMAPPDPLLERITSLGQPAIEALIHLVRQFEDDREPALLAISMLREMDTDAPLPVLIGLLERFPEDDDLCEQLSDSLGQMDAHDALLELLPDASDVLESRLLDLLVQRGQDDAVFTRILSRFEQGKERALMASYLGKYGDDRALPALKKTLLLPKLDYLSYLEIRNAIEQLGGDVPIDRDFSGDPDYESLRMLN